MQPQRGTSRRELLNWLLGASLGSLCGAIVYPILRFVSPPETPEAATREVDAGATNDPELLDKGFKIVRFGSEPVILIRLAEDEFRAFAATCTHLDCIVEYQKDKRRIWCNCHNGEYDLAGQQVAGPPPRPLDAYRINLVERGAGARQIVVSKA
jgi:Rieske Fe-S protein